MSEVASIEILGQKLSYPTTWQGVVSVFFVCTALVLCVYLFDGEKIKATGDAFAAVSNKSIGQSEALKIANSVIAEQQSAIKGFRKTVSLMNKQIEDYQEVARVGDNNDTKALFSDWEQDYVTTIKPKLELSNEKVSVALNAYKSQLETLQGSYTAADKLAPKINEKLPATHSSYWINDSKSLSSAIKQLDDEIKGSAIEMK